ncbi:MAG: DUF4188 domain-containing protein [bacterium]
MPEQVHPGRSTTELDRPVVVFLIGMRINRLRSVRYWWPVFTAMPQMLRELKAAPDTGLLGARSYFSGRVLRVVQYWRDFDALEAYARAPEHLHRPAWQAFNRRAAASRGAAGVFHETYSVTPGDAEVIYVDMPDFGLAAATGTRRAVVSATERARLRLVGSGRHANQSASATASPAPIARSWAAVSRSSAGSTASTVRSRRRRALVDFGSVTGSKLSSTAGPSDSVRRSQPGNGTLSAPPGRSAQNWATRRGSVQSMVAADSRNVTRSSCRPGPVWCDDFGAASQSNPYGHRRGRPVGAICEEQP